MGKRFPFHQQLDAMDCGPAALRMICSHHGREFSGEEFFDGRHWEDAQRRRITESGQAPPPDAHGAKTLQAILDRAPE